MSYILEALKRAQHERERGRVPAMQGALRDATPAAPAASALSRRPVMGLVAAAVLVVGAAVVWLALRSTGGSGAPPASPSSPQATRTPAALPTGGPATDAQTGPGAGPVALSGAGAGAGAGAASVTPPPVLPPVLPAPSPAPSPTAGPPPTGPAPPIGKAAPPPGAAAPVALPAAPSPPATAPPSPASAVALDALDAPTRARLPRLVLGGTIHASERSQRMVILDGQVLREGEGVAPGVAVQAIEPQGVLLALDERFGSVRLVRLKP